MKHLTDEQLSAYLDGAVRGREAELATRHIADCQPCREALAELAAQDGSLRPALTHDPGEAYFETFAARVEDRIRAAGLAGAPTRLEGFDLGRLFRSPRALAWAGVVAVVVVGGGLALMTWREGLPPTLRGDRDAILERSKSRSTVESPPAAALPTPPPATVPPGSIAEPGAGPVPPAAEPEGIAKPMEAGTRGLVRELAPAPQGKDELEAKTTPKAPSQADDRAATTTRAMEVRRTASGEDVPVKRKDAPVYAPAPSTAGSAAPSGTESQVRKKTQAELMQKQSVPVPSAPSSDAAAGQEAARSPAFAAPPPSTANRQALGATSKVLAGEVRVCGSVRDPQGRPLAGAQVTASDLGRGTIADAQGRFCLSLPPGEHPLTAMSVGYAASRRMVMTSDGEVQLTLAAVPVLEGDGVMANKPKLTYDGAPTQRMEEVRDPYGQLADSLRGPVVEAQRLEAEAASRRSASQYDAAAGAWERSLKGLAGGPLEIETRKRLATARYRAWELSPSASRSRAAVEALTAYVARAPAGPDRTQASAWLDHLRP